MGAARRWETSASQVPRQASPTSSDGACSVAAKDHVRRHQTVLVTRMACHALHSANVRTAETSLTTGSCMTKIYKTTQHMYHAYDLVHICTLILYHFK